jgi:hypothetical protein
MMVGIGEEVFQLGIGQCRVSHSGLWADLRQWTA